MAQPLALAIDTVPFPTVSEPWCEPADLTDGPRPCIPDATGIDVASICRVASDILRVLSGRRYGVRRTPVRPYRESDAYTGGGWGPISPTPTGSVLTAASSWGWSRYSDQPPLGLVLGQPAVHVEVAVDDAWLNPTFSDGRITNASATLTSNHAGFTSGDLGGAVVGAGIPAGAVIAVVVSSTTVTLAAAATKTGTTFFTLPARLADWYLYNDRLLIRARGAEWPYTNDLSRPLGEVGTWGVIYEAGIPVPEGGILSARAFACQLLKLAAEQDCGVAAWVSNMTRQGNTINLDPDVFLSKGRTGVMLADYWLNAVNPYGQRARARIAGPESIQEARPTS